MIKFFGAIFALLLGFFLLPKEKVGNESYWCAHSNEFLNEKQNNLEAARENNLHAKPKNGGIEIDLDGIDTGPQPKIFERIVDKSGLRKEVEGRLAWVGIDYKLDFLNKYDCGPNASIKR